MIPNGVYRAELEVETIINKMREERLRWFGHVRRRPQSAPVRRVEALVVDSIRRRGRPKLRWEDRVKLDMKELLLSEDMTSDRNEWRAKTSFACEWFACLVSFLLFLFGFCVLDSDRLESLCAALFCLPVCCCSLLVGPSARFKLSCPAFVFYLSSLCLYVLFALLLSKQTIVANSTTKAEYVDAANCCGQNPVFHSKTKHIEIRHHFIRDSYEKKLIQVIKIHTDHNVADILTKAFDVSRFNFLVASIGLELKGYLINNGYADLVRMLKELAIPGQTATGKEFSNQLMAGSLPKTISAKFWNTATSITINSVKQIHAIVDGKAVVISESSMMNDLLFDDEDGITCLTNDEIFKDLALMGEWIQVAVPGAKKPWGCLAQTRSERVLEKPNEPPLPEGHTSRSGEGSIEHTFELMDIVPPTPHDSPLTGGYTPGSDEGRLKLKELCVESSDDDLDEEDASKHGRTSDKTNPMFKDSDFDDLDDQVDERMAFVQEKDTEVSTDALRTPPTTTTVFDDEDVTRAMAQTLIKMKEEKAKEKGVAIKDVEDSSRPIRSITTLQPLPTIDPKDKGKGILQETEHVEKSKKKVQGDAQIERDFEIALRLQAELDEELGVERERQEEAYKVAIVDMFNELKGKSYEEIQGLYERQQKRIQDFTPMDSEKEAQKPEEEAAEYEKEKEELRLSLKIISNDDSEVNYEPLSRKFPIVNWEYQLLGKMEEKDMYVYKLTRADGSSRYHGDTQDFVIRLDRQDLNDLYRLVHERFQDHPLEGHDLLLWGDLMMIFDPDEKDELWMNQLDWKLLR
ncbi:hypothetical protein Tco_1484698 [Tanacetum coccineum]